MAGVIDLSQFRANKDGNKTRPFKCPKCFRVVHIGASLRDLPLPMCAAFHPPTMLVVNDLDEYNELFRRFSQGEARRIIINTRNADRFQVERPGEARSDLIDATGARDIQV